MAASSFYSARPSHRFLCLDQNYHGTISADSGLELTEWDLFNSGKTALSGSPEFGRVINKPSRRVSSGPGSSRVGSGSSSLPVNVPDWSKILREDHRDNRRWDQERVDDVEDSDWVDAGGGRLPPHVFLARTRTASFSVHEGVGRTLKGRDLSRVRNAIFEITGFQD